MGLSVLLRGTEQQKLKWTFDLYDVNKDGCVTKEVTVGNTGGLVGGGDDTLRRGPASALCPLGHAGDHEIHLCHDGPLHRARPGGQRTGPARGAVLPGETVPTVTSWGHSAARGGPAEPWPLPCRRWTGTGTAW